MVRWLVGWVVGWQVTHILTAEIAKVMYGGNSQLRLNTYAYAPGPRRITSVSGPRKFGPPFSRDEEEEEEQDFIAESNRTEWMRSSSLHPNTDLDMEYKTKHRHLTNRQ